MAGMDYSKVNENLVRSEIWANELKDVLLERLMADGMVRWLQNFPDGF